MHAVTTKITPRYYLPTNPDRVSEGGLRVQKGWDADDVQPDISVITVVLNGDDVIERTMTSVLEDQGCLFEYIVIDGGSQDKTIEKVQHREDRLAYWVSEPDSGISDAFNKGISLCRGKIIGIINAGDWYEPGALATVIDFFRYNQEIGVICGNLQFWQGNARAYRSDSVPALLSRDMSVNHPSCFVSRDLYSRYGGFDSSYRYAMDYELLLRFFAHGVSFGRIEQVLANMQHDGVAEQYWQKALCETHRARHQHLPGSFFTSRFYLTYLIWRKKTRFILQAFGCKRIIEFYRQRLAAVSKVLPK